MYALLSQRDIIVIFSYSLIWIIYRQNFAICFFPHATAGAPTFTDLCFYLVQIRFQLFVNNFQTFLLIVNILTNFLGLLDKFLLDFNVVLIFNVTQTRFLIGCSRVLCVICPAGFDFGRRRFV